MISRRKIVFAFALSPLAASFRAYAQQRGKVFRIGFLYNGSRQTVLDTGRYNAFLQGMRDLGYIEGKHFVIEARFADGNYERLPALVAELVSSRVDVIVASGSAAYSALEKVPRTIPIVTTVSSDPVGSGFASSLARPSGNFTGLSTAVADLAPKHIELLKVAVPKLSRVAVLSNSGNPDHPQQFKSIEAATRKLGIRLLQMNVRTASDIERSFAGMTRDRTEGVIILNDGFFVQQMRQIAELALKHRLPSIHGSVEYVESGGFMSYGPNFIDNFRLAAGYVDKILKGAKPADLPFQQPTRFYLMINRKTAKAIGLAIPQELLLRADKVIE